MCCESATPEITTYEVITDSHKVTVELITVTSLSEYASVIPKLTVDGKEATEINAFLGNYVQEKYPLEENGDYADGYTTQVKWGVKDFCDGKDYYDLKKSIKTISYDKFTPIVLNDGTLGAVGPVFYSAGQQFAGDVNMRLFDLKTTE